VLVLLMWTRNLPTNEFDLEAAVFMAGAQSAMASSLSISTRNTSDSPRAPSLARTAAFEPQALVRLRPPVPPPDCTGLSSSWLLDGASAGCAVAAACPSANSSRFATSGGPRILVKGMLYQNGVRIDNGFYLRIKRRNDDYEI
jgi:hypothetical protein